MEKMEYTFIDKDGRWGNLDNLLNSTKSKLEIKNEFKRLLNKYFVTEDTIEENDFESILNIYNEVFQTENVEDQIEENRDSFVREFFNRFQLFGLSSAFKKFQTKEDLLQHEERAVIVFTNKFTTCTLNEKEIASRTDDEILKIRAADVIDIVRKCYIHSHTKSCRKYQTECRFVFPKFPIWKTILSKPIKGPAEEHKALTDKYDKVLKDFCELKKKIR